MVFTDPPYNIAYKGGMGGDGTQHVRKIIANDDMSAEEFASFLDDVMHNLMQVTKGAFYVCMSSSELHTLRNAFVKAGGHWQTYIVWAKNHFTLSRTDYQQQHEPILYGLSGEIEKCEDADLMPIMYGWNEHSWYGGRKQGNVWHIDRPTQSKEHPTMKPVVLCGKAIKNSSKAGEIVLDVFGGSGSTLIAAHQLGRRCYMIELDVDYVAVIIERWCQLSGIRTIKKNGEDIEWVL